MSHRYTSTACYHEQAAGGDPALHDACRRTCKFCDAPCACPEHHAGETAAQVSGAWVDQARDMARELLGLLRQAGGATYGLEAMIAEDPALFWLRGQEKPPGEWREEDSRG